MLFFEGIKQQPAWSDLRYYGKMQHVKQFATLRLVKYEEETAAKAKAPPSTPNPSILAHSLTFKNGNTRHFLITLVSEKEDLLDVSW